MKTKRSTPRPQGRRRPAPSRPPIPPIPPGALWLRPDQTGEILQLASNHIYRLIRAGKVPHVRIGKQIRVNRQALADLIASNGLQV